MWSLDNSFAICSFFFPPLSLKVFLGRRFYLQNCCQAQTCTLVLVAIGEDWKRQEVTGQGRIVPHGSGCSPMSDPDCDSRPSDHLTEGCKLLHCTPANVNLFGTKVTCFLCQLQTWNKRVFLKKGYLSLVKATGVSTFVIWLHRFSHFSCQLQ